MKYTESLENKTGIMYGPTFCLLLYYYKEEKLLRYFQSHCRNQTDSWYFLAHLDMTTDVLRKSYIGDVILQINVYACTHWANTCSFDPLLKCQWSLPTVSWLYESTHVSQITSLVQGLICIKRTENSISTTFSSVCFSK